MSDDGTSGTPWNIEGDVVKMSSEAALALLLLAALTLASAARHINTTSDMTNISYVEDAEQHYIFDEYRRYKRESHSLIGPFDISKLFRKNSHLKREEAHPRASSSPFRDTLTAQENAIALTALRDTTDELPITFLPTTERAITANVSTAVTTARYEFNVTNSVNHAISTNTHSIKNKTRTGKPIETTGIKNKSKPRNKVSRKSKSVANNRMQAGNVSGDVTGGVTRDMRVANKKKAENESVWPVKHAAVLEGDIILGGLMMVRLNKIYLLISTLLHNA